MEQDCFSIIYTVCFVKHKERSWTRNNIGRRREMLRVKQVSIRRETIQLTVFRGATTQFPSCSIPLILAGPSPPMLEVC